MECALSCRIYLTVSLCLHVCVIFISKATAIAVRRSTTRTTLAMATSSSYQKAKASVEKVCVFSHQADHRLEDHGMMTGIYLVSDIDIPFFSALVNLVVRLSFTPAPCSLHSCILHYDATCACCALSRRPALARVKIFLLLCVIPVLDEPSVLSNMLLVRYLVLVPY